MGGENASGLQWLVGTLQQAPEEARGLGGFRGLDSFGFGLFPGEAITFLGGQPFFERQARFGGPFGFVGALPRGHGLR